MKHLLQYTLAFFAKLTLRRYRPMVVGITGSVGKTSTKEAIFAVLRAKHRVRRSEKNYNTEIGVPLTILGIPHYGRSVFRWFSALIRVAFRVLFRVHEYPEILVLEMGADRPGDIAYLTRLAPPFVGVITAIGEIPVHVEFFAGPREVAREKAKLIEALRPDGYAVLNCDDATVAELAHRTAARVFSYGFSRDAGVEIKNYRLEGGAAAQERGRPAGIHFQLIHGRRLAGLRLSNAFGMQQAYAAAAAACVGIIFNMSLQEVVEALRGYEPPPGRLKLLRGNRSTMILDDTYNASPASTRAALAVLAEFPAKRRIAVLGDMLELGTYTEAAHRSIGEEVARCADLFFAVGERMKFAMDEATAAGLGRPRRLTSDRVFWFPSSHEVGRKLESILQPGDVILVKGSQSMRMEKVVLEIMQEPERASELLVRQEEGWLREG